ncbi:MAG: pyridoxal phosphate-dependent aminotransferase family protein [Bacteroidetes bacterium]|nr:pyridoxal phosphate-dependent aminotransferase family protein [Bacteroidota bacterium]
MANQNTFDALLQTKLDERKSNNLYRSLQHVGGKIDFSSNDYLGFAKLAMVGDNWQVLASSVLRTSRLSGKRGKAPKLLMFHIVPLLWRGVGVRLKKKLADTPNSSSGATGSRLISGNSIEAEEAEEAVAHFHKAEAALIFNCGYMANVGLFSTIAGKGDTVIVDEFVHASIIDGIRLSNANKFNFRHNNIEDLELKLKKSTGNKFVAIESIYSMDGDEAPLQKITDLCEKYNAQLIVDEAHATGVLGTHGEGLVCKLNLQKKVFACVYTFGKAMGLHGAAVTGSTTLKNYLINFARPFIYSTALPPYTYRQITKAYELLPTANRGNLFELVGYFRKSIEGIKGISFIESQSQIQGIMVGDNAKAKALSEHLFSKGIYAKAILSPTVSVGTERLRICLHSFNTETEIDLLLREIKSFVG